MKYELNIYHRNTPDQELLDDLKKVALILGKNKVTGAEYKEHGKFGYNTISKRFGNWAQALKKSGLDLNKQKDITDKELFENIEKVWIKLGRQPLYKEIRQPLSKYSTVPYENRFGTWRKALEAFVLFVDAGDDQNQEIEENNPETIINNEIVIHHKTKRNLSERLKVQVLMRDGNKCRLCGITLEGDIIHFDHIKPWSKGGETVLENLQVLCAAHNLAKGDYEV